MKNLFVEQLLEGVYLCEGSTWRPRDIRNLSESSQKDLSNRTITNLFRDIKAKSFNLDFSDVEVAKGDITKIKGYKDLVNAISFLKKLSMNVNNKELIEAITQLDATHKNLLGFKQELTMGFKVGNNLVIYLFDSVAVALIQSTSFLVSEGIEIVKDNMNLYHCELKSNTKLSKNNNLSALRRFNEMVKNGKLKVALSNTIRLKEDVMVISMGVVGAILATLVLIREIVFFFYYIRINLSAYLKQLKEFVMMNASTLGTEQKNIKEKQEKIANKLGELSDKIAVDQNMANERSKQSIVQSNRTTATANTPENSGELADILY